MERDDTPRPQKGGGPTMATLRRIPRYGILAAERGREQASIAAGIVLGRLGRRAILNVHRDEQIAVPKPLEVRSFRFDVVDDLVRYTGLEQPTVEALLQRRLDSFRVEWYLAPEPLRTDDWYYRSSHMYLFGNAVHLHESPALLAEIESRCTAPGDALEFGGGTGNLALALAALGWSVDYIERSALQKDFVRFRIDRYGLSDRMRVLDDWKALAGDTYDLVCALDVLEHIECLEELLTDSLLPSIRSGGVLVESSPFARNVSNPMHHEHTGMDTILTSAGFALDATGSETRIWRRSAPPRV